MFNSNASLGSRVMAGVSLASNFIPGGAAVTTTLKITGKAAKAVSTTVDTVKVAAKVHKNSDNYVGHQGVYEIKVDGNLQKYGKADMTKTSSTGNPTRLQTQLNKLQKQNPGSSVTGKVIYENKSISTANIKKVETKYVQSYYTSNQKFPPGNQNHPGIKR
ncbi:hypothetical protein [Cohnella yongneupensis]|uniref:Uncharacterized protein n=1 Tax=Cohnella yongneupensis TaxID=425006 RepID=A0ABW0QZJ8_9BACL